MYILLFSESQLWIIHGNLIHHFQYLNTIDSERKCSEMFTLNIMVPFCSVITVLEPDICKMLFKIYDFLYIDILLE